MSYVLSYLYGSIPFSYIVGKVFRGVDVSEEGSGNVGASNVGIVTGSRVLFLLALALDMSKGILPSVLWGPVAGAMGVVGHVFSVFLFVFKFRFRRVRSGLGMAATLGWLLVNAWKMIPIVLGLFALFYMVMNPMDWRREWLHRWYAIEEGNIETVFAVGAGSVAYLLLFSPNEEVKTAVFIILLTVFYAYARVIRSQLAEFWDWKKSEKYLENLKGGKGADQGRRTRR